MSDNNANKSLWIKNSSGDPSVSTTFAVIAFIVTTVAYLVSMFEQIGPVRLRPFDVGACSVYCTPLLALYFGRRWTESRERLAGPSEPTATEEPQTTPVVKP